MFTFLSSSSEPGYCCSWFLFGGVLCCLLFAFLQYPGFLQSLHLSLQQYKRFAHRPCLELDRLPRKKKSQVIDGAQERERISAQSSH